MAEIVFEDPPPRIGSPGSEPKIVKEIAPLRANPGKWARIAGPISKRGATQRATNLNRGNYSGIEKGEYEAVSRLTDAGYFVWARYIGGEQ